MNLKDTILSGHSKALTNEIIDWIDDSPRRFDQLFKLFMGTDKIIAQRAGWPLSYVAIAHPDLIRPYIRSLLDNLNKEDLHTAIVRNTVRILAEIELPARYHGRVMDLCFRYISSPAEAVAVKAYSLAILEKLIAIYPEIKNELLTIIQDRWNHESAAFRSRAKKIIR